MSASIEAGKIPPSLLPAAKQAIVPAQLGFLAIYSPMLGGLGDDALENQIVYYSSFTSGAADKSRRKRKGVDRVDSDDRASGTKGAASKTGERLKDEQEKNERLRQIGLAQGMVEFAKSFSGGEAVDTVDTEKTRVIVHELEDGWWVVASIDLTRLPLPPPKSGDKNPSAEAQKRPDAEYSSREVKPAALLLADLERAHRVFLMHHVPSLTALWKKLRGGTESPSSSGGANRPRRTSARGRIKFMSIVEKYWDRFLASWSVLLHGNPIRDVFGGIRVAACGELGVGVGEEDRGSGERDALEGFVGRVEGLVDVVVGRFGEDGHKPHDGNSKNNGDDGASGDDSPWLGTGDEPGPEDGAVFLGVGALSRSSLKDVTCWMEDLYTWGEHAYGVSESPTNTRKARRRPVRKPSERRDSASVKSPVTTTARVPSIERGDVAYAQPAAKGTMTKGPPDSKADGTAASLDATSADTEIASSAEDTQNYRHTEAEDGGVNKLVSYLKLGYGTYWSLPGSGTGTPNAGDSPPPEKGNRKGETSGRYLVGFIGDIDSPETTTDNAEEVCSQVNLEVLESRTLLRTLNLEIDPDHVQLHGLYANLSGGDDHESSSSEYPNHGKLRVVVYVAKPFIYVLLFGLRTDSLEWDSLYKSLHTQLQPLRKPLVASTNFRPERPVEGAGSKRGKTPRIYDLVYDVEEMTVHCTIPSIPEPGTSYHRRPQHGNGSLGKAAGGGGWFGVEEVAEDETVWSRVEALNTHSQLLNIWSATRRSPGELERTAKTSRGWWVVWSRIIERDASSPKRKSSIAGPILGTHEEVDEDDLDGESSSEISARPDSEDAEEYRDEDTVLGGKVQPKTPGTVKKDIFLIRRAGETSSSGRSDSPLGGRGSGRFGSSWEWGDGASRLAQGIGVDTKKYIEGLMSLNR
ncbi:hypothetical protein MKZ38_007720 [Zalerion maritima]|uniref:CCZ1/INTU/HSP4 first Longin domain-containing protein n=1 Tax=Zalerion maritima TaxID=339359 RepID=A0AAD5RIC4_9PEZI|nr:hypothetical protein MKZ38_007720 [Zalerion maritima]